MTSPYDLPEGWIKSNELKNISVCSDCWGELEVVKIDDHYIARCKTPKCTTPAFITKRSMDYRIRVNDEWYYRAVEALPDAIKWLLDENSPKSEQQLLEELEAERRIMITPPRQNVSFPDVAVIKKGTPKQVVEKDGKKILIQGKDLKNKFRIHFLPGTDEARNAFHNLHATELVEYGQNFSIPNGYEVTSIVAVIPSPSVWDSWNYVNSAYDAAGRRIGEANDDHYIKLRDPATGELIIRDGEPYKKFTPGDVIPYERNGKHFELKMKTDGRLRLVLKDLVNQGILVQCVLKTTSFYDCQNIKKQLAGIQVIADMVNKGNAGGVPIKIYRSQQDCVWNKPDGSAARVKQWFINLQADPEWVKHAFTRMGQNALVQDNLEKGFLPAPSIEGNVSPENEEFDDSDAAVPDVIDASVAEVGVQPQLIPATAPDPAQKLYHLDAKIVKLVAEISRLNTSDVAKYIGDAHRTGRLGDMLTLDEAREFASHLNG